MLEEDGLNRDTPEQFQTRLSCSSGAVARQPVLVRGLRSSEIVMGWWEVHADKRIRTVEGEARAQGRAGKWAIVARRRAKSEWVSKRFNVDAFREHRQGGVLGYSSPMCRCTLEE